MVLALPIHDVCVEQVNLHHDPGIRTDADLIAIDSQKLPPRGANPSLLTAKFVRASASEEEAYRFLGVATSTLSDYFVQAVFPRLSELDSGVCMEAMLSMMEQMPQLCREDARFWDRLAHLAPPAAVRLRPHDDHGPREAFDFELLRRKVCCNHVLGAHERGIVVLYQPGQNGKHSSAIFECKNCVAISQPVVVLALRHVDGACNHR